jgi:RNA polymerase sigma factor (sigma-70 family)
MTVLALTRQVSLPEMMSGTNAETDRRTELDERSLEAMLTEHGGAVKGLLIRRYDTAFGAADVDDVMAIAVEKLWRHRDRFDSRRGSLKAWFFRIADNAARDILRYGWFKAKKMEVAVESGALEAFGGTRETETDGSTSTGSSKDDRMRAAVREAIAALPEAQRRILWADALSPSGPVPTADLARELGLSRGTVRVYRSKALAKIRSELSNRNISP